MRWTPLLAVLCGLAACGEVAAPDGGCATLDQASAQARRLGQDVAAAAPRFSEAERAALGARLMAARLSAEETRDWAGFCRTLGEIRAQAGLAGTAS